MKYRPTYRRAPRRAYAVYRTKNGKAVKWPKIPDVPALDVLARHKSEAAVVASTWSAVGGLWAMSAVIQWMYVNGIA